MIVFTYLYVVIFFSKGTDTFTRIHFFCSCHFLYMVNRCSMHLFFNSMTLHFVFACLKRKCHTWQWWKDYFLCIYTFNFLRYICVSSKSYNTYFISLSRKTGSLSQQHVKLRDCDKMVDMLDTLCTRCTYVSRFTFQTSSLCIVTVTLLTILWTL